MVEEMIKEFSKVDYGNNEQEINLEGHRIIEITNKEEEKINEKKKCCN